MPMTIITVVNAPPSLRGDLTKWMQEIETGVYVGNFNAKIREQLWERVKNSIRRGQATLSYHHQNELGYQFETFQTNRKVIDYDGIQLVLFPTEEKEAELTISKGFSNAAKYRKIKKFSRKPERDQDKTSYIVLDIETNGLDSNTNRIIEIGAIRIEANGTKKLDILINIDANIPRNIVELTGITKEMLEKEGIPIIDAMEELRLFTGTLPIIGYAVDFDIAFINSELARQEKPPIKNKCYDLMRYIKRQNMFLDSYRLEAVLQEYEIHKKVHHRALQDTELIHELATKVNGFLDIIEKSA